MLKRAQRATGKTPSKLKNPPTILSEFIHIWQWFEGLISFRDMSFGIAAIQPPVIESYFRLMWIDANPEEVWVLMLIDEIFVEVMNSETKK